MVMAMKHRMNVLMYNLLELVGHGIHPDDVVTVARWHYGVNPIPDMEQIEAIEARVQQVREGIERVERAKAGA